MNNQCSGQYCFRNWVFFGDRLRKLEEVCVSSVSMSLECAYADRRAELTCLYVPPSALRPACQQLYVKVGAEPTALGFLAVPAPKSLSSYLRINCNCFWLHEAMRAHQFANAMRKTSSCSPGMNFNVCMCRWGMWSNTGVSLTQKSVTGPTVWFTS